MDASWYTMRGAAQPLEAPGTLAPGDGPWPKQRGDWLGYYLLGTRNRASTLR